MWRFALERGVKDLPRGPRNSIPVLEHLENGVLPPPGGNREVRQRHREEPKDGTTGQDERISQPQGDLGSVGARNNHLLPRLGEAMKQIWVI